MHESVQACMVTGPGVARREAVGGPEVIDEVAIRIKHANRWDTACGESFLPPCLAQQVLGRKGRRGLIVFVPQNWRISKAIIRVHSCYYLHWNEMLPGSSP